MINATKELVRTYFIYVGKFYVGTMLACSTFEAKTKFWLKDMKHSESCYKAYSKPRKATKG